MVRRCFSAFVLGIVSLLFFHSCGLETYYYIEYVQAGNYDDVNRSRVSLPSTSKPGYGESSYFSYFEIFYRIYISGALFTGRVETPTNRQDINSQLQNDFQGIYPLTDITNINAIVSNLETTFYSRKYYKLILEGNDGIRVNVENVLGRSSLGKTLHIEFPANPTERPTLRLNDESPYFLVRANDAPSPLVPFNPLPEERYFLNDPELTDNANAYSTATPNQTVNADTLANTGISAGAPRYTYVSMYIYARGRVYLTNVYSQPTFIGIFKLPESMY